MALSSPVDANYSGDNKNVELELETAFTDVMEQRDCLQLLKRLKANGLAQGMFFHS